MTWTMFIGVGKRSLIKRWIIKLLLESTTEDQNVDQYLCHRDPKFDERTGSHEEKVSLVSLVKPETHPPGKIVVR